MSGGKGKGGEVAIVLRQIEGWLAVKLFVVTDLVSKQETR